MLLYWAAHFVRYVPNSHCRRLHVCIVRCSRLLINSSVAILSHCPIAAILLQYLTTSYFIAIE